MQSLPQHLTVFGLAGAIVTAATAWTGTVLSCQNSSVSLDEAAFYNSHEQPGPLGPRDDKPGIPIGHWPRDVPPDWPAPTYRYVANGPVVTIDATLTYYPGCKGWWGHGIGRVSAGWPFRALSYELQQADALPPGWQSGTPFSANGFVSGSLWSGGIPLPASSSGKGNWVRLPIRPSPLGFLADGALFGALIWSLFGLPAFVRGQRRSRRGQCRACGYPLGPTAVCPECGSLAPVAKPA